MTLGWFVLQANDGDFAEFLGTYANEHEDVQGTYVEISI